MRIAWWKLGLVPVLVLGGCLCAEGGGGGPTSDAGFDAGVDSGVDAGALDAGADGGAETDAGELDGGPELDAGTDAGPPREPPPEGVFQSSGGGTASSTGFRARVSFGAPQPMGQASGTDTEVTTGPAAAGRGE